MQLYKKAKNIAKKVILTGILTGSLFFGAKANAQEIKALEKNTKKSIINTIDKPVQKEYKKINPKKPKRKITLDFANSPLINFDANAKIWYSINQLLAKGNDILAKELNFDNHILGRIGQTALSSYISYITEYYSHEFAHNYEAQKKGFTNGIKVDWTDWGMGMPKCTENGASSRLYGLFLGDYSEKKEKEYLRGVTNGLNQDETDAFVVHENTALKKSLSFDEAIAYLIPKNMDMWYILVSTKGGINYEADYKPINEVKATKYSLSTKNQNLDNDIDKYLHHLHRKGLYRDGPPNYIWWWSEDTNFKGIELTKKELLLQTIIADFLSTKTYDSVMALYNYLVKRKRTTKPTTIHLGRTEITPPLISHYLTKDGSFYDTNMFISIAGEYLLKANLGTDVDFIGHGKTRHFRTGGKLHMRNTGINFRPYVYLNSSRGKNFAYKGVSAGIEISVGQPGMLEILAQIGFNENDLIQNDIKGKENGIDFSAGIFLTY